MTLTPLSAGTKTVLKIFWPSSLILTSPIPAISTRHGHLLSRASTHWRDTRIWVFALQRFGKHEISIHHHRTKKPRQVFCLTGLHCWSWTNWPVDWQVLQIIFFILVWLFLERSSGYPKRYSGAFFGDFFSARRLMGGLLSWYSLGWSPVMITSILAPAVSMSCSCNVWSFHSKIHTLLSYRKCTPERADTLPRGYNQTHECSIINVIL